MGTRSKIIVNSQKENISLVLYKHWDGYPSDNLGMLLKAFQESKDVNTFKASCAAWYGREDMEEARFPFKKDVIFDSKYPLHGDLEYMYLVDLDAKNIDLFGSDYGCEKELFRAGKIHPMKEVDSYKEEYKAPTKKKITDILDGLNQSGVSLNGGVSDQVLIQKQLVDATKKAKDLQSEVWNLQNEVRNTELNLKYFSKQYFLTMSTKQLKGFLEQSGIKILKVTKRKGPGEYNIYLDDNGNFKEEQGRTAWQHLNWLASVFGLDFDIKRD